ncbi:hypothetical protein TSAR_016242 [Trichomalopsis sarcophagae]|uniref:Receptor ligand binding region domain-containing protein n=1 Tax=Trichomalopsis sarcophagae TaxID=543379 RepID=A0A232EWF2_9HYME|nr:hypothetical protein TSAR_016242 [Trichomalopsis sarcophagae]
MLLALLVLGWIEIGTGYNDFPSLMTANATMAVIVEKGFFKNTDNYRHTLDEISDVAKAVIRKNTEISGIALHVFGDADVNLARDYTVLLSVASCQTTWHLFKRAQKEKLVYLAVTEPDCPRLPEDAGISLPLTNPGEELPQIFLDLRTTGSLSWPKVNLIHDETFARDTISRVVKALSLELPDKRVSLSAQALFSTRFEKNENAMRQRVHRILSNYRVDQLGSCFMVVVTVDMVSVVMEVAKSLRLVHPGSQWLYVISDAAGREAKVASFAELLAEGENVAFVHNATKRLANCDMGLMCHVKELVRALAISLENSLLNELELYDRVTEEEFEVVRLSKAERKQEIVKSVNRELSYARARTSSCGKCVNWRFSSAITWGTSFASSEEKQRRESAEKRRREDSKRHGEDDQVAKSLGVGELLDAGTWSPGPGVNMSEPLFPHVKHGFRGRSLPVSTFHVGHAFLDYPHRVALE